MTLESKLRALVGEWRNKEANVWDTITIKDCADELEALLAERQESSSEDSFTQGVLFAANFLEREADANFMPNEPAKLLLKGMASALRINMRASGLAAEPSSGTGGTK